MISTKFGMLLLLFLIISSPLNAQAETTQVDTFKVWGNCNMCKKTIEKALKIKGVVSAKWNKNTQMMTVTYNPTVITLDAIHKRIASVGYDTERETADDKVYNNLHGCCQYERKKNE